MGACSSCLGRRQDRESSEEDENSRLLFDDPHGSQYGTLGDHHAGAVQADPLEVQRETEALQKVVMQTSNHLVDIFALTSQNPPPALAALPAHDSRFLRYQGVLAKISSHSQSTGTTTKQSLNEDNQSASEGWMSEDDELEDAKSCKPVKSEGIGPILGGFADADFAMV